MKADSEAALLRAAARRERVPALRYDPDLPVVVAREEIAAAIAAHPVVVIAGETGSGKTTQIPKICLELGRGSHGWIGHTQPRRLAARTVAARIAQELDSRPGDLVGYQVRFSEAVSPDALVKLMTDGILLAEIRKDRNLSRYDTLIIDEAHERSLNIDFLLGYLRRLLPRRPDLKVIITSATIDVARFAKHFNDAPVIEVSGRSYPVSTEYRPPEPGVELPAAVADALGEINARDAGRGGDVLVFLPGEREIRETAQVLRRLPLPGLDILPLYARLSLAEQNRVFDPRLRRGRRVVLATNVAETSLTVPGIHYVIDSGLARISRYSARSRLQRLPVEPVSRASADQRQGRCGRIAPGVCYRLYAEDDYLTRPAFTDPEILRTPLAAVILQMLSLGLGDIAAFPFIEPPDPRQVSDGFRLLEELGAVDTGQRLTPLGRQLARLPIDPALARIVLQASQHGCLREILIIVSALSVQDPRERPAERQQAADERHRRFEHEDSDFLAFVQLWDYVEQQRQDLSGSAFRRLCEQDMLSWLRLREWRDVHHQLRVLCREQGWRENAGAASFEAVHRALLAGLLGQVAQLDEQREYLGARNRRLRLFPGSCLFRKSPKWIVSAEVVETRQVYARCNARIDPQWLFGINDALLHYSHSEPHWHARSGRVMAFRSTRLFGLVIRERERIHYGPVDPALSRELLIREGLVAGNWRGDAPFLRHNRELVAEIQALEDKGRRRDLLADEEEMFRFFDERLPADITTARRFEQWRRDAERDQPRLLCIPRERLLRSGSEGIDAAQFPDTLALGDLILPLRYHFEPGHAADGVTLEVPLGLLNRIPAATLDYLVPGLLRDKCVALVKTLPKPLRRHFVPVPDAVDRALPGLDRSQPLTAALAAALRRSHGVEIAADAWQPDQLETFYRMNLRVLDADGQVLDQDRDLDALRERLREHFEAAVEQEVDRGFERREVQRWDFGALPERMQFEQAGVTVTAYPALQDEGDRVVITLVDSAERAAAESEAGLVRLLMLETATTVKYLRNQLLRGNELHLQLAGLGQRREDWLEMLLQATYRAVFLDGRERPADQAGFRALLEAARADIVPRAQELAQLLVDTASEYGRVRRAMRAGNDLTWLHALEDIRAQLDGLFHDGFIRDTPLQWLRQYPRYLRAIAQRLDKLRGQFQRDRELSRGLSRFQRQLEQATAQTLGPVAREALAACRWGLEEYRVSLFAQQLGTLQPISEKRLGEAWRQFEEARRGRI